MEHNVETQVVIPMWRSLISAIAAALLFGLASIPVTDDWRVPVVAGAGAFALGFACVWAAYMAVTWPRREPVPPERMVFTAEIAAVPLAFDARDARRFVADALLRVNGQWTDKGGGASVRAMEAKGWSRERWNAAVGWLMDNGLLRWRNEAEHRAGLEWDFEKLDRFMEV